MVEDLDLTPISDSDIRGWLFAVGHESKAIEGAEEAKCLGSSLLKETSACIVSIIHAIYYF